MQSLRALMAGQHRADAAKDMLASRQDPAGVTAADDLAVAEPGAGTADGTEAQPALATTSATAAAAPALPEVPTAGEGTVFDTITAEAVASEAGNDTAAVPSHGSRSATPLPPAKGGRTGALVPGNIDTSSARSVDLCDLARRHDLKALGCGPEAVCPALAACSQQRYVCTHNPLNASRPANFSLQDYYPEAYFDDKVFVIPNVLQEWNGNVVGLQKGGRPTHYWLGMCPWGSIKSAKSEIQSLTLHVPRAASLIHVYAVNFYHFLAETLPKYYTMMPLLRAYPDVKLLIAHRWSRMIDLFFPEDKLKPRSISLKFWGAGKPKVKPRKESRVYKYVFSNQFFVPLQPRCGMPPMAALAELRRDYLRSVRGRIVGPKAHAKGLVLLYARNNVTTKRALRENVELHTALVRAYPPGTVHFWYGIWPSRLRETISPVAHASVLVGPHGAGLAAMLFLPTGGSVLELRQDHKRDPHSCFQAMAYGANISFDYVFGHGTRDTMMSVNVTRVVERVKELRAAHWKR